jgi:ribose 5-phosphate isomerase B
VIFLRIIISNDHAATELKQTLLPFLRENFSAEVTDSGSGGETGTDYPQYAQAAARSVAAGEHDFAILLCGTGAGMCMTANKIRGIRAVVCSEPYTARLAREHNNAQILCIGARVVGAELAKDIVGSFLNGQFLGGRHTERVAMMESDS